jgi:hypothetical protein
MASFSESKPVVKVDTRTIEVMTDPMPSLNTTSTSVTKDHRAPYRPGSFGREAVSCVRGKKFCCLLM